MDRCASVLLAFPPDGGNETLSSNELYDRAVRVHITRLNKLFKEQESILDEQAHTLLQHVNPAVNSLSYLGLLQYLFGGELRSTQVPDDLLDALLTFLLTFDARQIRYAGAILDRFLVSIKNGTLLPPSVAVDAISSAILRIDPTGSMFTSHHLGLVKLAYTTGNLSPALGVISKSVVFYPSTSTKDSPPEPRYLCDLRLSPLAYITRDTGLTGPVRASHVLEYEVLCGQVYCELRDWRRAFDAFGRAVSHPTRDAPAVTRLMAEAYSRWVLVGLLLHGRGPPLPAAVPGPTAKTLQTLGKPYLELARAFEAQAAEGLRGEAQGLGAFFQEEGTAGLVREVLAAFQRWQIVGLRDVYAAISLAEMRERTQSAETGTRCASDEELEALLADMIASGMLRGVVARRAGAGPFLTFLPEGDDLSEAQLAAEIAAAAQRIRDLEPVVKATGERLSTSRDYIQHLVKEQKREKESSARGGHGLGAAGPGELMFDTQVEDEDLMTGIMAV